MATRSGLVRVATALAAGGLAVLAAVVVASPAVAIVGGTVVPAAQIGGTAFVDLGVGSCTGTLIAPTIVLTAGHCVYDTDAGAQAAPTSRYRVTLGRADLDGSGSGGERLRVRRVAWPDAWRRTGGRRYDVGVLELRKPAAETPTPLAGPADLRRLAAGRVVRLEGWGTLREASDTTPARLRYVDVPVIADATCATPRTYGDYFDPDTMLCAGRYRRGGADHCYGDSGGPLTVPGPGGVPVLAGVISFARGCARPFYPGVSTELLGPVRGFVDGFLGPSVYGLAYDRDAYLDRLDAGDSVYLAAARAAIGGATVSVDQPPAPTTTATTTADDLDVSLPATRGRATVTISAPGYATATRTLTIAHATRLLVGLRRADQLAAGPP